MDIEIRKLSSDDLDDFCELIKIFVTVFETSDFEMPDSRYLQSLLDKPDFFVLVAMHEGKVIGGLTVYILHLYYSAKPSAYIYDVGVRPGHQRKGVGKKLIAYLSQYCKENGFEDAFVQAETDDTHAVNFYRKTPISSQLQATQFTYLINDSE